MEKTIVRLTVLFEDPFWIGIWERTWKGRYEVCKITFGPEPKDSDVYDFTLKNYGKLIFRPSVLGRKITEDHGNPKRLQRQIRKQLQDTGMGTKAQQALKLQQEQGKTERKKLSREKREAEQERRFIMQQRKRKEKHRGH